MSYRKAMKWHKTHKGKAQYMGFGTLSQNERRKTPWLGGAWYEPGMDEKRAEFICNWQTETERMLKENPNLIIV